MGASNAMVRDVFASSDNHLLAKNSIAFYRRMMEEHEDLRSSPPLLDLYGYLWLLPERLRDDYQSIVGHSQGSIDAELLNLEDVRSCPGLEVAPQRWYEGDEAAPPERIAGGLFGRNCGAVAPEKLAHFYHREAEHHGVEFLFDAVVQRLSFEGREEILLHEPSKRPFAFQEQMKGRLRISRVRLSDGRSFASDLVVVAGGAWAGKILHPFGVATACSPRQQILYAISGPVVKKLLSWRPPVHPIATDHGQSRFPFLILPSGATLKPIFPQGHMWVGIYDSIAHPIGTREDPGQDGRLDYDPAAFGDREAFSTDVLPAITPYFPAFETQGVRLENTWGGYYNMSPEGSPVLAEEPYGVIFVGGDSGSGVMKADSLGRLVTAACEGRTEARLFSGEPYRLDRLSLSHRAVDQERIIL